MAIKTLTARVQAAAQILVATMTTPVGTTFLNGSDTDKSIDVDTNSLGFLIFDFNLHCPFPGIKWDFTLTDQASGKTVHSKSSVTDAQGNGEDTDTIQV